MNRIGARVNRDRIRSAGLRRWDGRARITTDWVDLFHEPELYWLTGDCLVYLHEPGQSNREPAFRVHTAFLKVKGFDFLVDRCVVGKSVHAATQCILPNYPGCNPQEALQELYLPAPYDAGLEDTFNYHVTTRNFFAWLYNRPLAGRTLGKALVELQGRIDLYRPDVTSQNTIEVAYYAENQRYLDFRECVDHALAALYFAENFQIEDLWVDAFAHCVGMSHRGLHSSIEYAPVAAKSKTLISRARLQMDLRLDRVNQSVVNFFEHEVSGSFLELPQPARHHLDRFRSFLRTFYTYQYGCWPPNDFEEETIQQTIRSTMFTDFQNLYQYLVDPESSTSLAENDITQTGGVCTLQNIQAFDCKHQYEPLAHPLPLLPKAPESSMSRRPWIRRQTTWNLISKRKVNEKARKVHDKQALVAASNRDWVMNCPLVRKFSDFEERAVDDNLEGLSVVEGRKVRWMLIYAILQTFRSMAQPPKQVRNTSNLSYSLCCYPPKRMPWLGVSLANVHTVHRTSSRLAPDAGYSHINGSSSSIGETSSGRSAKARHRTPSAHLPSSLVAFLSSKTPSGSHSSLKSLASREQLAMPRKRSSFCEIYVKDYGNGLNEVDRGVTASTDAGLRVDPEAGESLTEDDSKEPQELLSDSVYELATHETHAAPLLPPSDDLLTTPPSNSRESSSICVGSITWLKSSEKSEKSDSTPTTPASDTVYTLGQTCSLPISQTSQ
ncbi:uncharacterized protein Z518_04600 [Rhinocladiella mackenziei CBS 650.93]|uniref:DUF8004 domain-containing protein n=1 Tax=Rhinocladiella mackenziei CBS 650.93 TaxID=1442369 RepID=A0A0D2ILK7_9EURO|nr:uncharacterized protein Z518_04600 [Rhinocladiella mackenziei CBS 650.93]KIX06624.1 hypothetical protein Z518_04600 [Rhinocladiella mackenziei CBS 650.93]